MTNDEKDYILKSCPSLGEAVNKAARYLPDDHILTINVENGASWVELNRPNGETTRFPDEDGLIDEVNLAIQYSNNLAVLT